MKNINDMIEERNTKIARMKELIKLSEKEDRKMSDTELIEWQQFSEDVDVLKKDIDQYQKMEDIEKENLTPLTETDAEEDEAKRYEDVFFKFARNTKNRNLLTPEEGKILNRAQTVTTTGGGYLIPEGFGKKIIEYLAAFGGIRAVATQFKTEDGADLPFPTNDDSSNKGSILTINTQISEQDLTFGQVVLGQYMYTSKLVKIPWQLIQDSFFDFATYLAKQLATRLGRIHADHFTTGTGTAQPQGVATAATEGKETASATVVTRSEILDLIHAVNPVYRTHGRLMFADSTLKALRQLTDGDSRPLYQPNFSTGAFDMIEGEPYTVNQSMAAYGTAGNRFMLYGDFSYYYIRDIMPMSMSVLLERYADYLQNGYFAYMRSDGDLMNTSAVKYMKHAVT